MKENEYNIDALAVKGYNDPPKIIEIILKYVDIDKQFIREFSNKLESMYESLGWGLLPTQKNASAHEFFEW